MSDYRSTPHELRYFASDLSKYIGVTLPKTFTSINGDIFQFKRDKRWFRLIEYKQKAEGGAGTQEEAYKKLILYLKPIDGYRFDCYLARGDPPFENGITITDFRTNQTLELTRFELDAFLSFQNGYCTIDEILTTRLNLLFCNSASETGG